MKLAHLCALTALPLTILAVACGGSAAPSIEGSSSSSASTTTLHGAYVPVGSSVAAAEYRALVFTSDADYFAYQNNCTGAACRSAGTYTFDGGSSLELHPASGKMETLSFKALKTASASALIGDLVNSGGSLVGGSSGGLVSGSGGSLIGDGGSLVGDGGSLIGQILSALINGIEMALQGSGSGDDGGASSGSGLFCDPVAATADCAAQGGNQVTIGSDGSCTCTVVLDGGAPDAAPSTPDAAVSSDAGADAGVDAGADAGADGGAGDDDDDGN